MRWLLACVLVVALVACGGGDDSGDDTTATVAESTVTTTTPPSPTATPASSPTSAASPSAVGTGQRGGIEPDSTAETGQPTPTRRPVTVVTTPRPIAKTPTPQVNFIVATATPTAAAGFTVVVDDTFDDPAATMFFTGETDFGVVAAVENGLYTLSVPEQAWQNIVAIDAGNLGNAAILIEAGLQGDGAVGVVGRSIVNSDDTWTFYVCWLATDGRAGCHVSLASEWVPLFTVEAGTVPILEVNTLFLSVVGDQVYFEINDSEIGVINDSSSAAGNWGMFAESFTGTSVAWYERITIATYDE